MFQRSVMRHDSPSTSCSCGFYAQYNGLVLDYQNYGFEGSIQAHGLTILGTKGIRTQFAEIESLYITRTKWAPDKDLPYKIAEYYKVPLFTNRAEWLEAFPPQDVSAIAPLSRIKPLGVEVEDCGAPNDRFAHRVTVWMSDGSRETYPRCKYAITIKDRLEREVTIEFSNEEGVSLSLKDIQIMVNRVTDNDLWGWDRGMSMTWHQTSQSITYNPGVHPLSNWINGNNNQYSPIWRSW